MMKMEEQMVIDKLILFGLTRQEAAVYLCLYRRGGLTGYEAAKYTGISRSNVYNALSGLADKGAAYLEEGSASRYVAVQVEEFCENKISSLVKEKEYLTEHIPKERKEEVGYLTITGCDNILDKAVNMLKEAQKRVYLSASYEKIQLLKKELCGVAKRQIKLVLITDKEPEDEGLRAGSICYIGAGRGNDIRLIIDSGYALTGELNGTKEDTCLYTGQENFIKVFKEALRNEITLIQLKEKENIK